MNCPFCQQQMLNIFYHEGRPENMNIWQCDNHASVIFRCATYASNRNRYENHGIFLVPIKDRWYAIEFDAPTGSASISEHIRDMQDEAKFHFVQPIISFTKGLRLTPDNALDKLKTILVFM